MSAERIRSIPEIVDWLDAQREKAVANCDYRVAVLLRELAVSLTTANDCEAAEARRRIQTVAYINRAVATVLLRLLDEVEPKVTT